MDLKDQVSDSGLPSGVRRPIGNAIAVAIAWPVVFIMLISRAHSLKTAAIEAAIGLAPFLIGGGLWLRGRRAALEEARQARFPMNLP
jgi:hypothetical protein